MNRHGPPPLMNVAPQVSVQIEGSTEAASKSEADRAKIRTVLGSRTSQEAILK